MNPSKRPSNRPLNRPLQRFLQRFLQRSLQRSLQRFPALAGCAFLAALAAAPPAALAQKEVKVKIEAAEPEFDDLASPEVGGNTGRKSWRPKDWLEFEVKVRIDARPEPSDGYIDSLKVKWFVAVANRNAQRGDPKYLLMEKEISHVNVPVGEDFYISAYLSPATIKRLTGRDRAGKSAVWGVGGEITCPGAVEPARFSSKTLDDRKPWWTSGELKRAQELPLLNKDETPFKFLWWDRYLQIESQRS